MVLVATGILGPPLSDLIDHAACLDVLVQQLGDGLLRMGAEQQAKSLGGFPLPDHKSITSPLSKCVAEMAQQKTTNSQQKTKCSYDKQSTDKKFSAGDSVLVLMPDDAHKLYAKWVGPYKVINHINDRNYVVQLPHRRVTMHANMLRQYHNRTEIVNTVMLTDEDNAENDLLPLTDWNSSYSNRLSVGRQLTDYQRQQLLDMLEQFPDVLTDKLGKTDLASHVIRLKDQTPCVQKPYKVPEKLKPAVEKEIAGLLEEDVIEQSD